MRAAALAACAALALCVGAASGAEDIPGKGPWMGRVLYDASLQGDAVIIGRFETAEACLKATNDAVLNVGVSIRSGPECGRDCEITDHEWGRWKCAEIRH